MRDAWTIFRREFRAFVRSRAYLLGTLFGPLMIALFFVLPVWFMSGGGVRHVAIVDGTGRGLGGQVSTALREAQAIEGVERQRDRVRVDIAEIGRIHGSMPDSLEVRYREWVAADSLDGFLWLPAGVVNGALARYVGENATSFSDMGELRAALQRAVQVERLRRSGIDPGPSVVKFAQELVKHKSVRLRGLQGYEGYMMFVNPLEERKRECLEIMGKLMRGEL